MSDESLLGKRMYAKGVNITPFQDAIIVYSSKDVKEAVREFREWIELDSNLAFHLRSPILDKIDEVFGKLEED